MKKSIVFLLAATSLNLPFNAFAGGIDEVAVLVPEIVIPKMPGGFFVGGSGYYLQLSATGSELDYASVNPQPVLTLFNQIGTPSSTFSSTALSAVQSSQVGHVLPNYSWGWGAFIGYTFPGTGNDITLDYFHFQGSDNDLSVVPPGTTSFNGSDTFPISNNVSPSMLFPASNPLPYATVAEGHTDYYVNQLDLTLGQFIAIGSRLLVHPNIGIRWATLHRDVLATFTSPVITFTNSSSGPFGSSEVTTDVIVQTTNTNSHYSGLGPVLGLDLNYDLWYGFAAVGHFDGALLAGTIHTELRSNFNGLSTLTTTAHLVPTVHATGADQFGYSATSSDIHRLVPAVDAKMGLNYVYDFRDGMVLTAEIGWGLSNYFNVVDSLAANEAGILSLFIPSSGTPIFFGVDPSATITDHTTADIAIQGLYFDVMLAM